MDNRQLLDYCLEAMKKAGADQGQVTFVNTEMHELNTESNVVKLMRSNDGTELRFKFIKEKKAASTAINKTSKEAIDEAVLKLVDLSEAAPVDEANDVSELVEENRFELGVLEPNLDEVYDALEDLNNDMKTVYSKIRGDATIRYDKQHKIIANTNGVFLEEVVGKYNFSILFSAKDGDRITSFNYTGASTVELKEKLTKLGYLGDLFDQTIEELNAKPFQGKFLGDVIIAPSALEDFLHAVSGSALSDGALIKGSSKFKDKMGQQVASKKLTWHSNPRSNELATGYVLTHDGYIADDVTIIENGVLKSFLLTQYGAKKTNEERALNYGNAFIVDHGDQQLDDMIKNVKQGILLTRFSGGRPGPDGGFAGVAKNSFYIEDGKIQYPMTETMISGNLFELLNDIEGISKETVNYGSSILPWIHSKGATISGQ